MPNLDKTGPAGQGSKTGNAMGICAGNKPAGTVGVGFGMGRRGCGRGLGQGRGQGRRRCCQNPLNQTITKD